jgi:YidC/Oxa1 family membrane protein insertase
MLGRSSGRGIISVRDFSVDTPVGQNTVPHIPQSLDVPPVIYSANESSPNVEVIPIPSVTEVAETTEKVLSAADLGNYPSELVMKGIELAHQTTGLPYWMTIVGITLTLRTLLLPVAFQAMRNSAKMANMKPELDILQERMKSDPSRMDMHRTQLAALYKKHDTNPFRSLMFPLLQAPIFISFFFGLKSMGDYYPGLSTGGAFWFTDLTVADPTMIFPIFAAGSFFVMIELGADGMQTNEQTAMMKNVMRGMAVAMVPITYSMPAAVFCYWTTANMFSVSQTLVLKVPGVREALDVPLPRKPPPTSSPSIPKTLDFTSNPVKTIMAKAKGESLSKMPVSEGAGDMKDGSLAPGSFAFDDKKHVKLKVHSENPMKKGEGGKKKKKSSNKHKK